MIKEIVSVWVTMLLCFSNIIVLHSGNETLILDERSDSDIRHFANEDGSLAVSDFPEELSNEELDNIRIKLQEGKYYPSWFDSIGAYRASNPKHDWSLTFNDGKVMVNPGSGEDWSWHLIPSGFGYGDNILMLDNVLETMVDGHLIEFIYNNNFEAWYINDENGLEHGFDINAPPQPRKGGDLLIEMNLETLLSAKKINNGKNIVFQSKSEEVVLNYGKLLVTDAKGHTLPSSIHMRSNTIIISVNDTDAVYPITVDPLLTSEVTKLTASDGAASDWFGYSVSNYGDTVVVGAYNDDIGPKNDQGSAYIFVRNQGGGDSWGELKQLISSDGAAMDGFGSSVSISGDTIVVGASRDDVGMNGNQGSAYVFKRNQGGPDNWGEVAKLTSSDGAFGDYFGYSTSIFGDTIVVGAIYDDINGNNSQGSSYVFERNKGGADNWGESKKLLASDGAAEDWFGSSVSLSGDTIVIGAIQDDNSSKADQGSAYIYGRNQGGADNWGEVTKLTISNGAANDLFGGSVSISGDTVVVGAYGDDILPTDGPGTVSIFERNHGGLDNWGEVKKLISSDGGPPDSFGYSVCIYIDTIVVGAKNDNVDGNSTQGSVYIFDRNQGGADNWGETIKLTSFDGAANDNFGESVSIWGNTIIAGAVSDDIGSNPDQGSANIFVRNGNKWMEQNQLIASDGEANDWFGYSVSISDDTIVIGAFGDDIGAKYSQGSAYIFERNRGGADNWGLVKKITASDGREKNSFGSSVSIHNDIIVVSASGDDIGAKTDQGSAYIFERNHGGPDNWGEVKKLLASDGTSDDHFGNSVSIWDDTVVIGAFFDDVGANGKQGSAYIYERNYGGADNWGEVKRINGSGGGWLDHFGQSVSISIDTIVVGAHMHDIILGNEGAVYIFERNQGGADNWGEVKNITASDIGTNALFGSAVSINDDTIVVGASHKSNKQGGAYIFERNYGGSDNWGEVKKITASDGEPDDNFGFTVSIYGGIAVVGAYLDEVNGNSEQGSAYIYQRNLGGPDNWEELVKLTASDGVHEDDFGRSVSVRKNTIVVGAYYDNVSSNSNQGSSYIYCLNHVNTPPNITTTNNENAIEDSLYSVDYGASDIDGNELTWDLWTNTDGWLSINTNTGVLSGTPDNSDVGSWTVNVTVEDGNGGIDWSNFTLNVTNVNPIIVTSDDISADEDILYTVDYNSDDDGQGTITWSLWTDTDGWLAINTNNGLLSGTPDNSDVGNWIVNVTVNDGNGGIDYHNFTLEVSNAPLMITTADNEFAIEDVMYIIDYDSNDDGQGNVTWNMWTDTDGWLSLNMNTGILMGTPDNTNVGSWTVNVSVNDGNNGTDYSNFTLVVNNSAPSIITTDETTAVEDSLYSVDYNSDDDGQGIITWDIVYTNTDGWLSINSSSGVLSGTPDNSNIGDWNVNISVEDGNGGIDYSNFTLKVYNVAPYITIPDIISCEEDSWYYIDYDCEDDNQGIIVWNLWTDADDWLTLNTSTGVLSGTPDNTDVGSWIVNISIEDGNGGIDYHNFTLMVSNVAPVIITANNISTDEDDLYYIDYDSDDDGQGMIIWSLETDADGWLSINESTGVLFGTPENEDVGSWVVNVSVLDGNGGIDFSNFTLIVVNTNDAPEIVTENVNITNGNELYHVDYDAFDEDLDYLNWVLNTNASWLNIDSLEGVLYGTPKNSDSGYYLINITVMDSNNGYDFTEFILTVINTNIVPSIQTSNKETTLEGELYIVDYEATDDDLNDTLTWSLDTNASWLSINPSSGNLSGTPSKNDVGSYLVKITVSDGNGGIDFTEFVLEVLADSDGDGISDSIDTDDDNDGYLDNNDAFAYDPMEWLDTDSDGIGDNTDSDDDSDGYDDDVDDFPLDETEWLDTDNDGIGNNEDPDDDNDGVLDAKDKYPLDPLKSSNRVEESHSLIPYLILIVVIVLVIILMLVVRNKRETNGETDLATVIEQTTSPVETQQLRCPQCQNIFKVPISATEIQCPSCGYGAGVE